MSDSPFLTVVRDGMRLRGYSLRTEQTYLHWIKFFILFNQKRHPEMMEQAEITAFLTYLAIERHVAINTQKVALNALVYLLKRRNVQGSDIWPQRSNELVVGRRYCAMT